ncbi:MAG: glycosyltransferase family 4 protein [SAR324 cluster bacterium]|nr:glycosyltransferase family 4 protein [SAR324 cluster bacterium]
MEKKKVLIYINNVDWYFCLHWLERAKAARNSGYEVWVFVPITDPKVSEKIRSNNLHIIDIKLNRTGVNPFKELHTFIDLYRKIKGVSPDFIHNITVKPNIYGSLIGKILHVPVVSSVTGLGFVFLNQSFRGAILRFIVKGLYRVVCTPNKCRLLFENKDDQYLMVSEGLITLNKTNYVPGAGINTDKFAYHDELTTLPVRILYAGRILWDKGIQELVDASDILKKRQLAFEIIVAGIIDIDNPSSISESNLNEWQRKNLIKWIGPQTNMPELIASTHIVVLPSYREGLPSILAEAASCGRPIVATDVPGCREIVRHEENGLLVPPKNSEALANALERLIKDPEMRRKMGERGRQIVINNFSDKIVIEKTLEIYRELLES